jgi:hypothetical protein
MEVSSSSAAPHDALRVAVLVSHVNFSKVLGRLTPPDMHPTCGVRAHLGLLLLRPRLRPLPRVLDDGSANASANGCPVYAGQVRQRESYVWQPCCIFILTVIESDLI